MKRVAGEALAKCSCCNHFVCVKTITYPLRLEQTLYKRVKREADRREKKLSDTFRDLISYGFETLPPLTDKSELVAEIWDKLGPAPEILYENYKRGDVSLPTI